MSNRYDAIVIGSGQGGGPLAGALAKAGRHVALVESEHVGGTCVNEGCTPTKTMIASARAAHLARRAPDYGVHAGTGDVRVDLEDGGSRTLTAPTIVLDVGTRPAIPPVDGLDTVHYLTNASIMELGEAPEPLVVLGGGYVGVEFAQMFRRFGSRVTLLQRGTIPSPARTPASPTRSPTTSASTRPASTPTTAASSPSTTASAPRSTASALSATSPADPPSPTPPTTTTASSPPTCSATAPAAAPTSASSPTPSTANRDSDASAAPSARRATPATPSASPPSP